MSARDSFEFNTSHNASGVRVLLVEFHELAVEDFHHRLRALSASLIARVDSTPLAGAPWAFESLRHCVVFIRLREQHMHPDRSPDMEAFLAQLAMSPSVTVVPITHRRAVIEHFRRHLSSVSPIYLGNAFVQEDLLNILGACAFVKARRKVPLASAARELSHAEA